MLNSPLQHSQKDTLYPLAQQNNSDQLCQHGFPSYSSAHSLLGIPSETLTGITAYLDPPSLLSLSRVNSTLHHHVGQDNTWRRAFASRYLGIGPECDLHANPSYSVLFRRSERTWKIEFISRFKLERKWENSRSASISHSPLPSAISHIHLMPCQVVLSACLKYGIVARSLPLNGKVYSGYLSAAADGIGMGGIGNPNMEFAPNASTCAIASRWGSANLLWGFLDGSVAVVYADKVMNPRRVTAQLRQCNVHDQHHGSVSDSAWAEDTEITRGVTGGKDGQVKLWWNSDPLECLWTSDREHQGFVPDPCTKVAIDKGAIAATFHSGRISLWTGFPFRHQAQQQSRYDVAASQIKKISIPCPLLPELRQDDDSAVLPAVESLYIDASNEGVALLVVYKHHPFFYRVKVAISATDYDIETTAFGDAPISCVSPQFAPQPDVGSFVIAGDYLGCISIYDWRSAGASHPKPIRKFEAHEDGAAVTAIAWNGVTLMTGSSRGAIHVWDGLRFIHLRSFIAHRSRRHRPHLPGDEDVDDETIKQIVIDTTQEMFVACAGDRVLAWKAGPLPHASSGKHRTRSAASHADKKNRSSYAKYLEQLEMKETIKESRQMIEQENKTFQRAVNREKEHKTKLDKLGLTETEAVEYVMMLSLEEAASGRSSPLDESRTAIGGVFDIDEASEGEASSLSYRSPSPASTASDLTWSSGARSYVGSPTYIRSTSRTEEAAHQLQASPSASSVSSVSSLLSAAPSFGTTALTAQSDLPLTNEIHFPPISAAGGSTSPGNSPARNVSASPRPVNSEKVATTTSHSSPSSEKRIISKPKKSWSNVAGSPSSPRHPSSSASSGGRFQPIGAGSGVRYTSSSFHVKNDADMDEDLRYALELSLAEAQSKSRV